jgi:hypothetical protein
MRYRSQIGDFEELVADACRELDTEKNRETFKAFLLAALAGLRRNEIDLLEWSSLDFECGLLRIEATKYFEGKSESALGDIPLDPELVAVFRGFRAQAKGDFVIESVSKPKLDRPYSRYRCQRTFDALVKWLRAKGIKTNSPLHVLRKEFGSRKYSAKMLSGFATEAAAMEYENLLQSCFENQQGREFFLVNCRNIQQKTATFLTLVRDDGNYHRAQQMEVYWYRSCPRRSSHRSIHEIEHLPYGALRPTLLAESAQTTRY